MKKKTHSPQVGSLVTFYNRIGVVTSVTSLTVGMTPNRIGVYIFFPNTRRIDRIERTVSWLNDPIWNVNNARSVVLVR